MIMCSMSSKICIECGHSCHCRDVCTVRTDEDETVSACECNDCRCENKSKELDSDDTIPYISG